MKTRNRSDKSVHVQKAVRKSFCTEFQTTSRKERHFYEEQTNQHHHSLLQRGTLPPPLFQVIAKADH